MDDIKAYEDYLKVSINVISLSCNKKILKGSDKYDDKIYLIHSQVNVDDEVGHFDTVTKVNGVLGTQYFCDVCLKGFITEININAWYGVMYVVEEIVR